MWRINSSLCGFSNKALRTQALRTRALRTETSCLLRLTACVLCLFLLGDRKTCVLPLRDFQNEENDKIIAVINRPILDTRLKSARCVRKRSNSLEITSASSSALIDSTRTAENRYGPRVFLVHTLPGCFKWLAHYAIFDVSRNTLRW